MRLGCGSEWWSKAVGSCCLVVGLVTLAVGGNKSALHLLLSLELAVLGVTLMLLESGWSSDMAELTSMGLVVITIAGAESVVGLALVVGLWRGRGSIG